MKKGKTSTGFKYQLEENTFDDYELLEVLRQIDKGESGKIVDMVDIMFSEEQKEALKNHVREENGKVPASKLIKEVMEIFHNEKEGKNC